ncbi:MAG: hypothetical protein K2X74_23600, partial [Acetobacteraceae bacterium]|nr:hypothetical protein [Acetobacteraceae bacterium]
MLYDNNLWVFGGDGKDNKRINDVHRLGIADNTWHLVPCKGDLNELPESRSGHSAVLYGDEMIIFGGRNGRSHFADLYRFSFTARSWKKIKTIGALVKRRYRHTAVVHDRRMYVFGGEVAGDNSTYFSDFYELDLLQHVWTEIKSEPRPQPRSGHTAVLFQNSMYIYGGRDRNQQYFADIWCFDFNTHAWRQLHPNGFAPPPTYNHSSVVFRDCFYIFGGYGSDDRSGASKFVSGHRHGNLFEYSFHANRWSLVRTLGGVSPSPRLGHTMTMVDDRLMLFGGWDRNGYRNDLYTITYDDLVFDMKKLMHSENTADITFEIEDPATHS